MLKINNLWINNIGRFVDRQALDFRTLGNLVQVDGENRNTGGSSGSGKSTVFNALDYLLGLNDLPTTVLQSRLTKEPIEVEGSFNWDEKQLTIQRNKKGLKITIDGLITEGSSKITEEKLDSILGMPRHLFRKMLHKRQKEGGFFLDFTPKQMHEFLTDCLGLGNIREKTLKVENRLKELEVQKVSYDTKLASAKSALASTQNAILAVGLPPIRDIHQSVILELKVRYENSNQTLSKLEDTHGQETKELEKSRPSVQVSIFDRTNWEALNQTRRVLEEQLRTFIESEKERQRQISSLIHDGQSRLAADRYFIQDGEVAKADAIRLAGEIKKIRESQCPTCDQHWATPAAIAKQDQLMAQLGICKEKIQMGQVSAENSALISAQIAENNKQLQPVLDPQIPVINEKIMNIDDLIMAEKAREISFRSEENNKNKAVLEAFAQSQVALRNKQSIEINQARGQADVDRRAFDAAANKLKSYEEQRVRYEHSLSLMKANEAAQVLEIAKADLELTQNRIETEKAEELKKALKSFLSCSFDDALDGIGDTATRIIRCIPNMSNATLQFEGIKETKDGKIKEEVNAVISMDGELGIPIKSLSGGERSSVDLAVDLAVIDFVESKTGKGIDIFILDEPFTGLDTVSIEMALEVLKNSNINKRLIIVDHNPEVKQMVESRLVVVRDGSTSSILQSA